MVLDNSQLVLIKNPVSVQSEARPSKNTSESEMSLRPFKSSLEMKTILEHFNGTTVLSFVDFARYSQRPRVPALLWRFIFLLQKIICTSNPQQCEIKESNIYKVYTREWLLLLLLLQWRQLHREAAGFSATLSSPAMLKPFKFPFTHPPHPPLSNCKEFPE